MSLFSLTIAGNLGKDPEMRFTPDGKPVTSFSIAHSRKRIDKTETLWVDVNVWGDMAETCNKVLKKGSKVCVVASRAELRAFKRGNGEPGAALRIDADRVEFMSGSGGHNDDSEEEPSIF